MNKTMISIKVLRDEITGALQGICDKIYKQDRPTSVAKRLNSYLVVSFPSAIVNREIDPRGAYNDFTTTLLIEVYVRDKMSASNPIAIDEDSMDDKVTKVLGRFPIDTEHLLATRPEEALEDNDDSGFHVTLIRARLRTK